jgi:protein-tyrosine-phosphatase
MAHILIVCTANICRSPVASALIQDRLHKSGRKDWTVSSAGTWAMAQRGAAQNSIEVMKAHSYNITSLVNHQARMVKENLLEEADLVLCMEIGHVEALQMEFPRQAHKVYLITNMDRIADGRPDGVDDPYGGPMEAYETMYQDLVTIVDKGLERIITLAEENAAARITSPE